MADDRLIVAIGRLERALSRIETSRGPAGRPADQDMFARAEHERLRQQYEELLARYDRLRARAAAAVDRLDRLIG